MQTFCISFAANLFFFVVHSTCFFHAHALHGTVFTHASLGKETLQAPNLPRYGDSDIWLTAVRESGLNENNISHFGRNVPKYTAAEVQTFMRLNHSKTHTFNFQGSLCRDTSVEEHDDPEVYRTRRRWVFDFAAAAFSASDVLYIMDRSKCNINERMGPYDYSDGWPNHVDGGYFGAVAKSKFTLTPGGDQPWSARIWEAIAARSLPVISKTADDWEPRVNSTRCLVNQYHYSTTDNPVYNETLVEQNFRMFIRYQTFIEGDNIPPGCN